MPDLPALTAAEQAAALKVYNTREFKPSFEVFAHGFVTGREFVVGEHQLTEEMVEAGARAAHEADLSDMGGLPRWSELREVDRKETRRIIHAAILAALSVKGDDHAE